MATYKLIYFDLKGRAHVTRMLFTLAGQSFEEYKIDFKDWAQEKKKLPFEQAPVLEIVEDSKKHIIAQSGTINRFLANKFGYAGKDVYEKAQVDMIDDQVTDIFLFMIDVYKRTDSDEKTALLEKAITERVPQMLKFIQNILEANNNGTGFLVGDGLTLADLYVVSIYDWLRERRDEVLAKLDLLRHHEQRIKNYPILDQYLKETEKQRLTILFKD